MPLTDLSFLERGKEWPPPDEHPRLDLYRKNNLLWEGNHEDVYEPWDRIKREMDETMVYVVLEWPQRVSTLFADLVWGDAPRFTVGERESAEQSYLDELVKANRFYETGYEVGLDVSRYGTGLYKLVLRDGLLRIKAQPPSIWFPVTEIDDVREIKFHVLAWKLPMPNVEHPEDENQQQLLRIEIHDKGLIENRLHLLTDGTIGPAYPFENVYGDEAPQERIPTGVPEFLIVPVHNLRTSDKLFGKDDYQAMDSIVNEMEVRLSQEARIYDKHTDPNIAVPEEMFETNPDGSWSVNIRGGNAFPITGAEGGAARVPQYITWDGKFDAQASFFERLQQQLYVATETSETAFSHTKTGAAESGTSLRLRMFPTLKKAKRLVLRFDHATIEMFRIANLLDRTVNTGAPELPPVQTEWRDGLPQDSKEQSEIEERRVRNKLSSRYSAIARLDDSTAEQTQEELDRIDEEERGTLPEAANPETVDETERIIASLRGGAPGEQEVEGNGAARGPGTGADTTGT